jgi:hypothetical protein
MQEKKRGVVDDIDPRARLQDSGYVSRRYETMMASYVASKAKDCGRSQLHVVQGSDNPSGLLMRRRV